jgi:hypothetical protein
MSVIVYGEPGLGPGGVYLNVMKVNTYKREAVYAGNDYLYTRHTLSVRAIFNPGTQVDFLIGRPITYLQQPPHVVPALQPRQIVGPLVSSARAPHHGTGQGDRPAAVTAEAVKHVLMQPRLQLHWSVNHQTVLRSPLAGVVVDSTGGPKPLSCDVAEIQSGKTFLVDWTVQTDINECPDFSSQPNPVLSHQYSQEDTLDQDFLTVRVTKGTVVFDAALVRTPGFFAGLAGQALDIDSMRASFLLPVPAKMKRMAVKVGLEPDNQTLHYEVVDKELPILFNKVGVTRIEGTHKIANTLPGMSVDVPFLGKVDVVKSAAMGGTLTGLGEAGLRKLGLPGWAATGLGIIANFATGNFVGGALQNNWGQILSTSQHIINLKVWGTRSTTRNTLEDFARDIIVQRIVPLRVSYKPIITHSETVHDVVGNFVDTTVVLVGGPLSPLGVPCPTQDFIGTRLFGASDDTGTLLFRTPVITNPQAPPHDDKSRGTFLETLVASALSKPCDPAVTPTTPRTSPQTLPTNFSRPAWPKPTIP